MGLEFTTARKTISVIGWSQNYVAIFMRAPWLKFHGSYSSKRKRWMRKSCEVCGRSIWYKLGHCIFCPRMCNVILYRHNSDFLITNPESPVNVSDYFAIA